jgi:hypothetical protein
LTALTHFSGDAARTLELVDVVGELIPQISPDVAPREYAETLFFYGVSLAVVGHTELTTRIAAEMIEYCEKHGLEVMIPAALSFRNVALLKAATDPDDMRRYADELLQTRRGWKEGWANEIVGELYLRHPDLVPNSAERALVALRAAVTRFLRQEDYPYVLNALRAGALALARVGRPLDDAARLLSAVRVHADRLGLKTAGVYLPHQPWIEEALNVEPVDVDLSWTAMVALLAED